MTNSESIEMLNARIKRAEANPSRRTNAIVARARAALKRIEKSEHEHLGHAGPGNHCNAPACAVSPGGLCMRVSTEIYRGNPAADGAAAAKRDDSVKKTRYYDVLNHKIVYE